MTRVVGKGACDPCCTDWKQKIKELWENYQEVIKGIKAGPDTVYPDGNGIADIDGAIENEVARQISDESLVTSDDLQTAIADMATIQDLNSGLSTLQSAKQDKLVNQVNIKSINGISVLGSGDMQVSADSVAWDNVTDKPEFAEVATSGSYDDLTDKPTIPAAQVNADWNADSGVAQILNKPTLATVATTGDYDDLIDKPTIPTGADLVPSTSGITDGYVLTNDNGTPTWMAGSGGGGSIIHTYSTVGAFATDLLAHPNAVMTANISNVHFVYPSYIGEYGQAQINCRLIKNNLFAAGAAAANPSSTDTSFSFNLTGIKFDTTAGTFASYSTSLTLSISDVALLY